MPIRRPPRLAIALAGALTAGCTRAPIEQICPSLADGELVISELRGPQQGADTWGQWVEILNRRDQEVRLAGVMVRLSRLDGANSEELQVRDRALAVAGSGYVVFGRFATGALPSHVQYGYRIDYDKDLYSEGIVELLSCGKLLDRVVYRRVPGDPLLGTGLPARGSFGFDGARTLDSGANDNPANWCVDITSTAPGGLDAGAQLGLPGTPGRKNRPCK